MVTKALFVGLGSIGKRHLRNLRMVCPHITIAALRSSKQGKLDKKHKQLLDHEFYNLKEAKDFQPEIIFVTNPTFLHVDTCLQFADIVQGMFIEKPLSDRMDKRINDLIEATDDLITYVGYELRFNPVIKFLKNELKNRLYGRILSTRVICGSYMPDWRPNVDYRKLYSTKKEEGGGVALDLSHEIDYIRWLFGDIKKGYFGSTKVSSLDINVEDLAYGVWELKSGCISELHLDYFRREPKREIEIMTENAVIEGDLIKGTVKIKVAGQKTPIIHKFPFKHNDMYVDELKYFLDCVDKGKKTFNSVRDSIETLRYAIYQRENKGIIEL